MNKIEVVSSLLAKANEDTAVVSRAALDKIIDDNDRLQKLESINRTESYLSAAAYRVCELIVAEYGSLPYGFMPKVISAMKTDHASPAAGDKK